ncbi:MAG: type II toxin-antitoxin system YafQ family toxin [Defluviitaleaceae bacterium]|nr:type II toxin-antitoxin system YafQ family toxin [Defluviitaleaceae bacterium]
MNYKIKRTAAFRREFRNLRKSGYNMKKLGYVVNLLKKGIPLPSNHDDHALVGNWKGFRECHVAPDWLLIYKIDAGVLVLTLQRTGSHADLFNK